MLVFINLLRGIAALLVLFFHVDLHVLHNYPATPVEYGSFTYWFVFGFIDLGKYAVAIFFMISGFLIPSTLRGPGAGLRAYATHRFLRLYPAYWLSILIFIPIVWMARPEIPLQAGTILVNLTMLQRFVGMNDFIGVFWTLQIELVFYFVCAGVFAAGRIAKPMPWMIPYALAASLGCAGLRFCLDKKLPVALFIGLALMFLGDGFNNSMAGKYDLRRTIVWAAAIAFALIPICYLAYTPDTMRYLITYWGAILTFIAVYCCREMIGGSRVSLKAGTFFANCSYSVYLLQDPIGLTFAKYLHSSGYSAGFTSACSTILTITAACIIYYSVEAPAIKLGKRLTAISMPSRSRAEEAARMLSTLSYPARVQHGRNLGNHLR